jgi:Zn-dependent protease with chaperone function
MSLRFKILFTILYASCFLVNLAFGIRPTNARGLLALLFMFVFLGLCLWSLIAFFMKWKKAGFWALAPLIACLLMLPVERQIALFVRSELFKWRFPRYEALVQKIESGAIPVSAEGQMIPGTNYDSSLAYDGVWAQREKNGALIVEFWYGGAGPPPYHQAYLYVSSGVIKADSDLCDRWPSRAEIREKWFEVAD